MARNPRPSGRRRPRPALLLAVSLLAVACGPPAPVARDLILISIDTLRPDHLGLHGYELRTSPALDALAEAGVVFEEALAPSPWTLPSHASLFTGRYPSRHGVTTGRHALGLDPPTLAGVLSRHGYDTRAVVNAVFLAQFGMGRGFQKLRLVPADQSREGAAGRITDLALDWLRERDERPLLLFLHYFDVHSDYRSLSRYEQLFAPTPGRLDGSTAQLVAVNRGELEIDASDARHLALLYDAGIRQLDDELGRLFDFLREQRWLEHGMLVVTSDHGEEFLEHGGVLHGRTHYQEQLRVPLVWLGPSLPAGVRVRTPVSLVDVLPTALGLLDVPRPADLDGIDLRPLWQRPDAGSDGRLLFAETGPNWLARDTLRSVRRGRYKLITDLHTKQRELYDLESDPAEREDLAHARPELAQELAAELERFMADGGATPAETQPDPDLYERLRELGYVD